MRIAVVSDIHGNLTALKAVVADLRLTSPDMTFHGGDLAAIGARPADVVDRIRDLGWQGVRGNADEMLWCPEELTELAEKAPKLQGLVAAIGAMIPWTRAQLGEDRIRWLQSLSYAQQLGDVAMVHASPTNLWKAPLPDATDAELHDTYRGLAASLVIYGHIHRPFVRKVEGMTVANTGSVSLSYDGDPRASYLILDGANVDIRRVEYDLEHEAGVLLRSGLPNAGWVCQNLRSAHYNPPTQANVQSCH